MKLRIVLPVAASLAVLMALPASATTYRRPIQQGGGGAGPYAAQCDSFRNYNQRQACTAEEQAGMPYRPGEGTDGLMGLFSGFIPGGDQQEQHDLGLHHG